MVLCWNLPDETAGPSACGGRRSGLQSKALRARAQLDCARARRDREAPRGRSPQRLTTGGCNGPFSRKYLS